MFTEMSRVSKVIRIFAEKYKTTAKSVSLYRSEDDLNSPTTTAPLSRQNIIKPRRVDWLPVATAASTNRISQQSAA